MPLRVPGRNVRRANFSFFVPRVEGLEDRRLLSFITAPSYAAGPNPASVAVGDFNCDGIPDVAVVNYGSSPNYTDGGVSVLLDNGDGTFQAPRSYAIGGEALSGVVGDFNGDGKLNLAEPGDRQRKRHDQRGCPVRSLGRPAGRCTERW